MKNTLTNMALMAGLATQMGCITTSYYTFTQPMGPKRQAVVVDSLRHAIAVDFKAMQKPAEFPAYATLLTKNIGVQKREEAAATVHKLRQDALQKEVDRIDGKHPKVLFKVDNIYTRVPDKQNPRIAHLFEHVKLSASTFINDKQVEISSRIYPGTEIKPKPISQQ